jgi:acetoin utilization protein AcuB
MSKRIPSISKYMTTTPHTANRDVTLAKASALMRTHGIRHLPVMDGDALLGVITERDIKFAESFSIVDPEQVTVYGAMAEELYCVDPETPLDEVAATMAEKRYGSAIIVQNKRVVGVFTTVDACRALSELLNTRLRK